MSNIAHAEEQLRIIRSLMEKATIYRAISAPGALIGGLLAVILAVVGYSGDPAQPTFPFVAGWFSILLLTSAANTWLLWRDARRRGELFVSPGMKLALRSMAPGLIAGGLSTGIEGSGGHALTATLWVLCYGLSLLAASHFAPRSIQWLGLAFFLTGGVLLLDFILNLDSPADLDGFRTGCLIMGLTFGVFHLLYAFCILYSTRTASTWKR